MLKTVRVPAKFAPLFEQAQSYVERYFAEQKATPEHGTLEINGQRYVLVRAASMSVEFFEVVRNLYGAEEEALAVAHGLLFDIAHAMGLADAGAFASRMQLTDPIARLSAGPVHFAHAGWAFVDILSESSPTPDENYCLVYDHPYSFESDAWIQAGKSSIHPVCTMNAGYSSGWCEHSFGVSLVAVEILCRAKGDDACRFVMAPPDRIEDRIQSYVHANPELKSHITNYQIPGFFAKRTDPQLLRANLELERRARLRTRELWNINEQLERDITERRAISTALGESRELTERVIEALPGGLVQVDKDGTLLRANAEALRILGLTPAEFERRDVASFEAQVILEDGSSIPVSELPVSKAIRTGEPQPAMTLGVRRPDGDVSWSVYRAVPTRDATTHDVNGAVVTFLDITERKRFEDKLRHAQKLESLGVLAGGIAHDFNNLLATILANASFAATIAQDDSRLLPLLDEIQLGARRAADLTSQMLDYAGRSTSRTAAVDLSSTVREMADLVKAVIPKQVELFYRFQDRLPHVLGDATQIRQVIMNLITNAAEAIGSDAGTVTLSVSERRVSAADLDAYLADSAVAGSFVCLEVTDTGCGMDESTVSRVFDPFFSTKFKGRGLGMAALLGILRAHRAAIRIDSQPGSGTTITVLFPASGSPPESTQSARGTGVLVVDDDAGVQLVLRRALSRAGYRVLTAGNGLEAIRSLEDHGAEIDLIVMDMTMPHMGGVEALSRIRSSGSRVPVLLISGYELDATAAEIQAFSGYIQKPFTTAEVLAAVERALTRR